MMHTTSTNSSRTPLKALQVYPLAVLFLFRIVGNTLQQRNTNAEILDNHSFALHFSSSLFRTYVQ